jgi:hypothetical protein
MMDLVDLFLETTRDLPNEREPEKLLIRLLDREAFYKRLCSHHDVRESQTLYPALDKSTTEEERAELFVKLAVLPTASRHDGRANAG